MTGFVAEHRHAYGVEPIRRVLQIAPSTCYSHMAREADLEARPDRWWRDRALEVEVHRVWGENKQAYGARKVWRQLLREGWEVARCTVERLMRRLGLRGVDLPPVAVPQPHAMSRDACGPVPCRQGEG